MGVPSQSGHKMKLEGTLPNIEKESEALLKIVTEAARAVRRIRSAAKVGDLLKLRKALEAADQSCLCLRNEMVTAAKAWELDDVAYLSGKGFQEELLDMARQMDVDLIEQDGTLVAYPISVRILPQDRKVAIDRTQETGLRPSVFIKPLKEAQSKPKASLLGLNPKNSWRSCFRRIRLPSPCVGSPSSDRGPLFSSWKSTIS